MISKDDAEYLKELPYLGIQQTTLESIRKVWYTSDDTLHTVALILDRNDIFKSTGEVISFFEKPWKWEQHIQELIKEYEKQEVS